MSAPRPRWADHILLHHRLTGCATFLFDTQDAWRVEVNVSPFGEDHERFLLWPDAEAGEHLICGADALDWHLAKHRSLILESAS